MKVRNEKTNSMTEIFGVRRRRSSAAVDRPDQRLVLCAPVARARRDFGLLNIINFTHGAST